MLSLRTVKLTGRELAVVSPLPRLGTVKWLAHSAGDANAAICIRRASQSEQKALASRPTFEAESSLSKSLDSLSDGLIALSARGFPVKRTLPSGGRRTRRGDRADEVMNRPEADVGFLDTTRMLGVVASPAQGMVERQKAEVRQLYAEDRMMQYQSAHRAEAARQKALRNPAPPPAIVPDTLKPAVVANIIDDVATRTGDAVLLAAVRKERAQDALALTLEQLLTGHGGAAYSSTQMVSANPSASKGLKVLDVEDKGKPRVGALGSCLQVTVRAPDGTDGSALQLELNRNAKDISRAMSRKMLTALVPDLRFIVDASSSDLPVVEVQQNRLTKRRKRHVTVQTAARSWAHTMEWRGPYSKATF